MRKLFRIFSGALTALALLAGPALARTSESPKPAGKQASPACSVYQRLPDGSWAQAPCEEINPAVPANQKTSTRSTGVASH
jgi:hypothetical protein